METKENNRDTAMKTKFGLKCVEKSFFDKCTMASFLVNDHQVFEVTCLMTKNYYAMMRIIPRYWR